MYLAISALTWLSLKELAGSADVVANWDQIGVATGSELAS